MKKWHYLNEDEFNYIKRLQAAGLKRKQLVQVSGRSYDVVLRVERCKSFDEYKMKLAEKRSGKQPKTQPETVSLPAKNNNLGLKVSYGDLQLTRIANALEKLVELRK